MKQRRKPTSIATIRAMEHHFKTEPNTDEREAEVESVRKKWSGRTNRKRAGRWMIYINDDKMAAVEITMH